MRAEPIRARRATCSHLEKDASPCFPIRVALRFQQLLRDEDGPTAVEYAVMIGLILVACIAAISMLGNATAESFDNMIGEMRDKIPDM
jgi:pilus assembly protein Flp/PilA